MIHLIGKTSPIVNAINALNGHNDLKFLSGVHHFWCVAMPCGDLAIRAILDSGAGYVTIGTDGNMFVSGNTLEWHALARYLLRHDQLSVKKFGTLLVQSYPEIFKDLSTTQQPNGILAIRS